jgi:hypothetical protein
MKAQAKDSVAVAMDWLAQLRDEDSAEQAPGDGEPAIDSAPPAGDFGDAPPAAPPVGELGDAGPAAPPAVDWGDARPAGLPASDFGDVAPAAPPPVDWEDAPPAAPPVAEWRDAARAAPTVAEWPDAAPAAPPAADSWRAAASPVGNPGPAAGPSGPTSPGRAGTKAEIEITERAAIGDELRIPLAWCEMGSCISHYGDPAALGEADIRARAIAAGWRADALGRLACPQCQQGDSWFWTAHPVALWDRDTAVAMTTLMAAAVREITRGGATAGVGRAAPRGRAPRAVPGPRPEMARPPGQGRHRGHPAHPDRAR